MLLGSTRLLTYRNDAMFLITPMDWRGSSRSGRFGILLLVILALIAFPTIAWSSETAEAEVIADELSRRGLDQDGDVAAWFTNLERFLEQENEDLAVLTVQQLLDRAFESPNLVLPADDRRFVPLGSVTENMVRANPELLRAYVRATDPQARMLRSAVDRATEPERRRLLGEIESRFFLSSEGSRAAFELACILLDEQQFRMAHRLLLRAASHPGASVDAGLIDRRLAAVHAFLGDEQALAAVLNRLGQSEHAFPATITDQLQRIARREVSRPERPLPSSDRLTALGHLTRRAAMRSADSPADASPTWASIWATDQMLGVSSPIWGLPNMRRFIPLQEVRERTSRPHEITRRWRQNRWIPTGQLFFDHDTVYFRTHHFRNPARPDARPVPALVALSLDTGALKWAVPTTPARTITSLSEVSPMMVQLNQILSSRVPASAEEQLLFDDSIAQQINIADGVLYAVEGHEWAVGLRVPENQFGVTSQLLIGHRLISVDAATGRLRWRIAADQSSDQETATANFLSAPIRVGSHLLVTAEIQQTIFLIALDDRPAAGTHTLEERELWRRHLVSSHQMVGRINRTVGMAIDDGELFIATGRGIVTAVSPSDGRTLWTAAYPMDRTRMRDNERRMMVMGGRNPPPYGFAEDMVIPIGDYVMVLPSDAAAIHLFDRTDGRLLDRHAVSGLTYVMGAADRGVMLGGPDRAARYEIRDGRVRQVWLRSVNGKAARGTVTEGAVYVPSAQTIVQLDPNEGLVVHEIPIANQEISVGGLFPIGNLFATRDGMLVYQPGQMMRLVDTDRQLANLEQAVADQPDQEQELRLQKARLLAAINRQDQAAEQLRKLLPDAADGEADSTAANLLFDLLLGNADRQPDKARPWLDEAATLPVDRSRQMRLGLVQAAYLESQGEIDAAVDSLLAIATQPITPLLPDPDHRHNRLSASLLAQRHLSELFQKHPKAADQVAEAARQWQSEARDDTEIAKWVAWVGAAGRTSAGPQLAARLVDRMVAEHRIEEAERLLIDMLDQEPSHIPAYRILLAELYTKQSWNGAATRQWQNVQAQLDAMSETGAMAEEISVLARRARAALETLADAQAQKQSVDEMGLAYEQAWAHTVPATLIMDTHGVHRSDHLDRMVVMVSPQPSSPFLYGRTVDGSSAWQLRLADDGAAAGRRDTMQNRRGVLHMHEMVLTDARAALLRDGHIGVAVGVDHVMGYGLVNAANADGGQVDPLWRVSLGGSWIHHIYGYPGTTPAQGRHELDTVAVGEGRIALLVRDAATDQSVLRVFDSLNGQLIWERHIPFWQPLALGYGQGRFWVLGEGNVVSLFDRRDGRPVAEIPVADLSARMSITLHDEGLLYRNEGDGIALLDIQTQEIRWTVPGYRNGNWVLSSDRNFVLSLSQFQSGLDFQVIDVQTGTVVRGLDRETIGPLVRGYLHGDITTDGEMVLVGHNRAFNLVVGFWPEGEGREMIPVSWARMPHFIQGLEGAVRSILEAGPLIPQAEPTGDRELFVVRMVRRGDGKPTDVELPGPLDGHFHALRLIFARGDGVIVQGEADIRAFVPAKAEAAAE